MPAPPMYFSGSGQNHQKTIQKLLQLERIPIVRLQKRNRGLEVKSGAWKKSRVLIRKLSDKSRLLYSFAGPFRRKKIFSSAPDAIDGSAGPGAEAGERDIEVLALARHHQIRSGQLSPTGAIAAGSFVIMQGEKKVRFKFRGGTLADLQDVLRRKGSDLFDVSRIRVDEDHAMLSIRSRVSGSPGELRFKDPDGLLRKLGLAKIAPGKKKETAFKVALKDFAFYPDLFVGAKRGKAPEITGRGKNIAIQGVSSWRLNREIAADAQLKFEFSYTATTSASGGSQVEVIRTGPNITVDVEDVHLRGYDIDRMRRTARRNAAAKDIGKGVYGFGIIWEDKGKEKRSEVPLQKFEKDGSILIDIAKLSGGKKAKAAYFYVRGSGRAKFKNIRIIDVGPSGKGALVAAHETSPAQDAKLKIQGVMVKRTRNNDLKDIIRGATLNLKKITEGAIHIRAGADIDSILKGVRDWVGAYNELLKFCRTTSSSGLASDRSGRDRSSRNLRSNMNELRSRAGIFHGDASIRSLIYGLQNVTAQAYPALAELPFRVLSDIGISTGKPMSRWHDIKNGFLVVDEVKFKDALQRSAIGVRDIFAQDGNGDARIDNGVAYRMRDFLKPYARVSGGLISLRIQLIKDRIADNKKSVRRKQMSLKSVEQRLRRKFGGMERAMQRSKATGNYLRNQMPGFRGR